MDYGNWYIYPVHWMNDMEYGDVETLLYLKELAKCTRALGIVTNWNLGRLFPPGMQLSCSDVTQIKL